jgi:XRE family transcriptional regulator, regulator of sulfur utilization
VGAQEQLGILIRRLREERNLSVRTLATLTGFSPSFISQVETGQASPSIASLEKIATALGVSVAEFFQESEARSSSVVRNADRPRLHSGWSQALLEKLSLNHSSKLYPVVITIEPGGTSGKHPASTSREEFGFVLDGSIVLTLNEDEYSLQRGDAATIPANTPRRWNNSGDVPAQILIVSVRN